MLLSGDVSLNPGPIQRSPDVNSGPDTEFEFGWWYKYSKLLELHKCQKILQTGRYFVLCFMFKLHKYTLL